MVASAQFEDRSNFQPVGPWTGNAMGIVKATEGLTYLDPTFAANWANLGRAGLPRGAYHFFHPGLPALPQMAFFLATVASQGLNPGDVLALDQELWVGGSGEMHDVSPAAPSRRRMHLELVTTSTAGHVVPAAATALGGTVRTALDAIRTGADVAAGPGMTPVWLYTFGSMLGTLASCTGYDLWIASPGSTPPGVAPWPAWRAWQYTAGGGPGGGDRDAFNGTVPDLHAYIGGFKPKPPPVLHVEGTLSAITQKPHCDVVPAGAKTIVFAADPGLAGGKEIGIRLAAHGTGPGWTVTTVKLTPAAPVSAVPLSGADAVSLEIQTAGAQAGYGWR